MLKKVNLREQTHLKCNLKGGVIIKGKKNRSRKNNKRVKCSIQLNNARSKKKRIN